MSLNTTVNTSTQTSASEAAIVDAGDGRTVVSIGWDTSGAASITVEVSEDGDTWFDRTHDVISSQPGAAETRAESFTTGFDKIRAYVDSNINQLTISAKGS